MAISFASTEASTQASHPTSAGRAASVSKVERPRKLEALTSLRFFAAAMIFLLHTSDTFKFYDSTFLGKLALSQGVCFFFVLSGFILTYVHPELPSEADKHQFLCTRIARIWPTHAITMLACLLLFYHGSVVAAGGWSVFAANLLLVHSWLFDKAYSVSLNAPSWSISCEFFFYLCFPLLIAGFAKSWGKKLFFSFALVALSLIAMGYCSQLTFDTTAHLLIKTNPICRIFEFVLGMCIALGYQRFGSSITTGIVSSTIIEVLTLLGVMVALVGPGSLVTPTFELATVNAWLFIGGVAPIYGALIFVMACGRGLLSRLLSAPLLVHLGEISFSLYMVHALVLSWFTMHYASHLQDWSIWQKVGCIAALSLLISHVNYRLIETPCRYALTTFAKNGFRLKFTKSGLAKEKFKFQLPYVALVAIASLLLFLNHASAEAGGSSPTIDKSSFEKMLRDGAVHEQGILFGNQFLLKANDVKVDKGRVHVILIWEAAAKQNLLYRVQADLLRANGTSLGHRSRAQDTEMRPVKNGEIFEEQVDVDLTNRHSEELKKIGISLIDQQGHRLYIQNGERDSNNERLLLEANGDCQRHNAQ